MSREEPRRMRVAGALGTKVIELPVEFGTHVLFYKQKWSGKYDSSYSKGEVTGGSATHAIIEINEYMGAYEHHLVRWDNISPVLPMAKVRVITEVQETTGNESDE